ncbi:KRI1-like family C-terminal-domain-containing protein [Irpex rosettiformis]|uniref:KRI1-like family C-terminal-domain-containing protein n=1 Tax=Irpex rosettiformis TaxID=378272 RepID=A0ACB8U9F8_9APHY|nr:KRI1-like family C-terminal-domain-containing protein [Irpex rosettiformis]
MDPDDMDPDANHYDGDEWDGTEEMRKRKLGEYMDELYGLEFKDMVGDMPTRFKYTKVGLNMFALSPVDILLSTDAEFNQYVGLKKLAPYRKGALPWDKKRGARLKELESSLQRKVKQDATEPPEHADGDAGPSKIERRRHKKSGKASVDA